MWINLNYQGGAKVNAQSGEPAVDILSCECIVWDFDGTLFDLDVNWGELKTHLDSLLRRHPDYQPNSYLSIDGLVNEARRLKLEGTLFDAMTESERQGMSNWERGLKRIPTDIFMALRNRSALVSNNMSGTLRAFLERLGAPEVPFVTRDKVLRAKPDPEGLHQLKALWFGKRARFIGDSDIDLKVATASGIPFTHVDDLIKLYPRGLETSTTRGRP